MIRTRELRYITVTYAGFSDSISDRNGVSGSCGPISHELYEPAPVFANMTFDAAKNTFTIVIDASNFTQTGDFLVKLAIKLVDYPWRPVAYPSFTVKVLEVPTVW